MASFESKELMFSLALDDEDPEEERVVLRLAGCQPSRAVVSCGRTQNPARTARPNVRCVECRIGEDGRLQVSGADGLRSLQEAMREMLEQLEPVEQELRAFEAAQERDESSH